MKYGPDFDYLVSPAARSVEDNLWEMGKKKHLLHGQLGIRHGVSKGVIRWLPATPKTSVRPFQG
jgi:hypothetical protein